MANFSAKERLIASILSATPGLKKLIKRAYIGLNAVIYRKNYNHRILDSRIQGINILVKNGESFGGYYDKPTINNASLCLVNLSPLKTSERPRADVSICLKVVDLKDGNEQNVAETSSYTWQQGARAQWISDDSFIFNAFDGNEYKAAIFSVSQKKIVKELPFPVQDSYKSEYYLSINYRRIMALRPDYGYRNLPLPSDKEMHDLENDGIWKVSLPEGKNQLILSLKDVVELDPKESFSESLHKVNHVMISPDGSSFIFIHRWYKGKRRFDRLIYYDFKNIRVLADDSMVSHMCWIDNNTVFGYLRHEGKDGFYFIDVNSMTFTPCQEMTKLGTGDGHPTAFANWIAFDSYPDKSRMQKLYIFNRLTGEITPLLELHHGLKYMGECRCDLHPRFSDDGKYIFFDSVYDGKRHLCYINVSQITNSR